MPKGNQEETLFDKVSIPKAVPIFSIFCLITLATILTFASTMNPSSVSAATNSPNSQVIVNLPEIINLHILDSTASSDINNLAMSINPTPNGAFTKGSLIADVSTSNATGYKLYMTSAGKDHGTPTPAYTTDLVNTDGAVDPNVGTIPTLAIDSSITESEFKVSNSAYINKWGYSLNGLLIDSSNNITENTNSSDITYTDVPANGVNDQIQEKNAPTDHGRTPITFGANVTSGKASGTYKNTIEITAIANPLPVDYVLLFDQNTADAVTNMPSDMSASSVASSYTFTVPDTIPKRDAYFFNGWNTKSDNTGTPYAANDSITLTADSSNPNPTSETLYGVWESMVAFTANNKTWTKVLGQATFSNASSLCPTGYHIPTKSELLNLIGASRDNVWVSNSRVTDLYNQWPQVSGTAIWSSEIYYVNGAAYSYWDLYLNNGQAIVTSNRSSETNYFVACVK